MDDLLSVLTGGKESLTGTQAPVDPVDYAVRTVYGEADPTPESRRAVAGVIFNRSKAASQPFDKVVQDPGQFEAWADPKARAKMLALDPGSPEYQAIAADISPVLQGKVKVPYDHFYAPDVLKARGQSTPAWDNGTGETVGSQRFFALGNQAPPDLESMLTAGAAPEVDGSKAFDQAFAPPQASGPPPMTSTVNGRAVFNDTGKPIPDAQMKTVEMMAKGGLLDENAPFGSVNRPYVQRNPTDQFQPGQFYIEAGTGKVRQTPGAPASSALNATGTGFQQGLEDVGTSLSHLMPLSDDSVLKNRLMANQMLFDATQGGNGWAKAARLGGQVTGSVPLLMSGEGAVGAGANAVSRLAPEVAPAVDFLTGRATGNLLMRGGSRALAGAGVGASAAGLTSSASDQPLPEQLGYGAAGGALFGAAAPAISRMVAGAGRFGNGLLEPLSDAGRQKIADRLIAARADGSNVVQPDLTEYIPGSRPTTAEAYGNTGLATAQRGLNAANSVPFTEQVRANAAARDAVVQGLKGDPVRREALESAREAETAPLLEKAFEHTSPTDPSPAVAKIDEILAGKAGQRDAVRGPLEDVRAKLVTDKGLQTDPEQLWGIREHINDILSPLARGTAKDGRAAARELMQVKTALDPVIEAGAPGFKDYVSKYAELSKPINEHDFLQGLNLSTNTGNITLNQVGSALKKITALRAAPGVNDAKALSPETLQTLENLHADLAREANGQLGRGSGSDTVQKAIEAATTGALDLHPLLRIGAYSTHPAAAAASDLAKGFYAGQRQKILDLYVNRLLNPEQAQAALLSSNRLQPPSVANRLMRSAGRQSVLATGGVGSNSLLGP